MRHITFVKKILPDGTPCKKCIEVAERMCSDGVLPSVNQVVIADTREVDSPGMLLAQRHAVERAPFFIVEEDGQLEVFDIYFKFKKYLLGKGVELQSTGAAL
jgi:hypothetical protein